MPSLWWVDGVGAIIISAWIISRWVTLTLEQTGKIVGKAAPSDFVATLQMMAMEHHDFIEIDCTRAYHWGARFMVEVRLMPIQHKIVWSCRLYVQVLVSVVLFADFLVTLQTMAMDHHDFIEIDCTRAYHWGARFMVEVGLLLIKPFRNNYQIVIDDLK